MSKSVKKIWRKKRWHFDRIDYRTNFYRKVYNMTALMREKSTVGTLNIL